MTAVLIDTHIWAWSLQGEAKLTPKAIQSMRQATELKISPISFYEIAQKVRLGKWGEMAVYSDRLAELAEEQALGIAELKPAIAASAGLLDWSNRDPFDRIIAATARHYGFQLLSADVKFDGIVTRIW